MSDFEIKMNEEAILEFMCDTAKDKAINDGIKVDNSKKCIIDKDNIVKVPIKNSEEYYPVKIHFNF